MAEGKSKSPKCIFISSRMEELVEERRIAYSACHDLDLVPLMFEAEPIENVKQNIDEMIQKSNYFFGMYYETLGTHNYYLENLTPIEYELTRFIAKECSAENKKHCRFGKENAKKECLELLRKHLTLHFENDNPPEKTFCDQAIENCKDKVIIFFKQYCNEQALSPHLLALFLGFQLKGFHHYDFRTKWELGSKILHLAKDPKYDLTITGDRPEIKYYKIHYEGLDSPGQLYLISESLFLMGVNIHSLKQCIGNPDDDCATIDVKCFKYHPQNEITSEKEFDKKFKKRLSQVEKEISERKKLGLIARDLIVKILKKKISMSSTQENKDLPKSTATITKSVGNRLYVRVYHMDVPGILARITKILSGSEREVCPYIFNIERCNMVPHKDPFIPFGKNKYGNHKYFREAKQQFTEIFLIFNKPRGFDSGTTERMIVGTLDIALRSIVGVEHVIISDRDFDLSKF